MEKLKNKPYYEVREARDLKQLLEDSCRIYKDRPAYYVKRNTENYIPILYSELKEDVDALRDCINRFGLKR